MKHSQHVCKIVTVMLAVMSFGFFETYAQRQMEYLDRGLVAIKQTDGDIFVSWRLLGTDRDDITFNLYRSANAGPFEKINVDPLKAGTNYLDKEAPDGKDVAYVVRDVIDGMEIAASNPFTLATTANAQSYLSIPLKYIEGYKPNDASVGDLDGDGEYEIILHQAGRARDNSQDGYTDPPILQAYKLDGTLLWEINLGINIREGAHYTQFIVMDLDGDGKAELVCKTADGTVDGTGRVIGDGTKNWVNDRGRILDGPEFLTVFKGETGEALATTDYIPSRYPIDGWGRGGRTDSLGNRSDRFLAAAAYLDGELPSVVMCRGYYGRSVVVAWDFREGELKQRWIFDSGDGNDPFSGQGNHNLSVADIDGDGRDEIIYGAIAIDDNGTGLYTTGFGHGDALHVGDLIPSRPGLEVFSIHENPQPDKPGASLRDAGTGEIIWQGALGQDVGRGVAANIDPHNLETELWFSGSGGLLNVHGDSIGTQPPSVNFLVWWDGDLTRELLDGNHIDKYHVGRIFTAEGSKSINGTKSTPVLSADILGDWREEIIFPSEDDTELRIYVSTYPTVHRLYTLMHDLHYRLSIVWQNVAYNQPPHTGFYIGEDMQPPPKPAIALKRAD